jgi:drug/metabolite transporter (DMT)-like permease|tara:strand:- start:287 stop:1138 length:852 start_codon:yes stop_codon:yes gene_type:complete
MNKNLLGILLMTLGMFSLSINDIIYKNLTMNFPVWEAVFFRAFSGSIISLYLVYHSGINSIKTKKPVRHFVRAFSAVGCVVLYIFGIKYLLLSENIAIAHSAPIIAALLAVPILGEKIGMHRILAITIGFVGVLVIIKPGTDLFQLKSLLPIGSALFMASVYLTTRSLMNTESSTSIVFYYSFALLFTSLIFFPSDFVIPDIFNLILALSLGIMGSMGHFFMSQAARHADVAVTSPFEYSSFIFVGLMGYFFFYEIPSNSVILGGILIIISGVYVAYRERKIS